METSGKNRRKHHEAPWLPHALLQPPVHAPHRGAHEQLTTPRPLAALASIQCHSSAQHPRVHGSYTRTPNGLSWSQFSQPTPTHGTKHATHGATSIPMPSSFHRQIPSGGRRSTQFKHRRTEDESQGTYPVHGQNLATHVLRHLSFDCGPFVFLLSNQELCFLHWAVHLFSGSENFGKNELCHYIYSATGCKLPRKPPTVESGGRNIYKQMCSIHVFISLLLSKQGSHIPWEVCNISTGVPGESF